ncbi:hypothetical protein GQ53DRAFT_738679 [Thozetella sp. PMI_491]|nr:hypothetical protein GQ53DRAFT_738679 [Thozetella sp. PMI_491]
MSTEFITIPGQTDAHVTRDPETITIEIPTCIQTITPDANGYLPPGTCHALWPYYPNFSAAVAFTILYAVVTAVHIWQAITTRKQFCWVLVMASIWETCGFMFRAISSRYQQNTGIYLVFQVFVLLAPLWVNAFDYMVFGRMIYYFLPSQNLFSVPAPAIAAVFVALDFVAFIIQLVGGTIAGPVSPAEEQLNAMHIYMGGIGLQQFFIFVFVALGVKFQMDMANTEHLIGQQQGGKHGWRRLLYTLYVSLALITVRIMFRLIAFSRGDHLDNPLLTSETYFYALEAVPMLLAIISFNVTHPGHVFVGPKSEMPGFITMLKRLFKRQKFTHKQLLSDDEGGDIELASSGRLEYNGAESRQFRG